MDGLTSWSGFPAGLKPQSFGLTSKYVIHYIMEPQTLCKSNPKMCVCVCICIFSLTTFSWIWQLETEILIEISSVNERHK